MSENDWTSILEKKFSLKATFACFYGLTSTNFFLQIKKCRIYGLKKSSFANLKVNACMYNYY